MSKNLAGCRTFAYRHNSGVTGFNLPPPLPPQKSRIQIVRDNSRYFLASGPTMRSSAALKWWKQKPGRVPGMTVTIVATGRSPARPAEFLVRREQPTGAVGRYTAPRLQDALRTRHSGCRDASPPGHA